MPCHELLWRFTQAVVCRVIVMASNCLFSKAPCLHCTCIDCAQSRWNQNPIKCICALHLRWSFGVDFVVRKKRRLCRCFKRYRVLPAYMCSCKIAFDNTS
ncbi:hypothetical protein O6H91_03G082800 [Diphasiastrum complanatum]|nr:hypothetical protein O6H91_03G082800 [Diphasiastrum complanatum]